MRLLMIDNFDSFTYNLVQYLRELGAEVEVVRNDANQRLDQLLAGKDGLVVSPGPCDPAHAGNSIAAFQYLASDGGPAVPALGVCLGHQAMAAAFGGSVVRAAAPMHGKTSLVWHDGSPPFAGSPSPTEVMRYHSLVVSPHDLPACLRVTARTSNGTVMGIAHRAHNMFGVQFHPESILTGEGKTMLRSFLSVVADSSQTRRSVAGSGAGVAL
jgi:anthranilate synthase component 2